MFIRFKNSKATAVKISKLSMPAQGHAIANFAVPNAPVTCRVGIPVPISVPSTTVFPIKPKMPAARVAVVGTKKLKRRKLSIGKNVIDSVENTD